MKIKKQLKENISHAILANEKNMRTQLFIKTELFDCLNVHDIAMFSFPLNDETVSPQMSEDKYQLFMRENPKLKLNDFGELVHSELGKVGIALEYTKFSH